MDTHGLSELNVHMGACRLADLGRSTFQYGKQPGGDDVLRERLAELAISSLCSTRFQMV